MGQNTSISVTDVVNITSTSITNTMKSSTENSSQWQNLSLNCDAFNTAYFAFKSQCIINIAALIAKETNPTIQAYLAQQMNDVCKVTLQCEANNITMTSMMTFDASVTQGSTFTQTVKDNISDAVKAAATSPGGILPSDTSDKIKNLTNVVTEETINSIVKAIVAANIAQSMDISGGSVSFISMDATSDIIAKSLQTDTAIQTAATDVAKSISASAGGGTSIMKIVIIILICVACAGLAYWLYKKYSSSTTTDTTGTTGSSSTKASSSS